MLLFKKLVEIRYMPVQEFLPTSVTKPTYFNMFTLVCFTNVKQLIKLLLTLTITVNVDWLVNIMKKNVQKYLIFVFCLQELDEKQQHLDRVMTKLQTLEEV